MIFELTVRNLQRVLYREGRLDRLKNFDNRRLKRMVGTKIIFIYIPYTITVVWVLDFVHLFFLPNREEDIYPMFIIPNGSCLQIRLLVRLLKSNSIALGNNPIDFGKNRLRRLQSFLLVVMSYCFYMLQNFENLGGNHKPQSNIICLRHSSIDL